MEDLTKTVLPLNIDSGSDPFLPLPAESASVSLYQQTVGLTLFSQLENNTNHFSSQIEGNTTSFLKGGNGENAVFPSQVSVAMTSVALVPNSLDRKK